ncbi:MAG: MBL fold metallo-hydrolase [Bacteroidota bacterium]
MPRLHKKNHFLAFLLVFIWSCTHAQTHSLEYVANMGVKLDMDGQSFLMDALHDFYKEAYRYTPAETIDQWYAEEEFSAALVSHAHGDHFDERLSMEFLRNYQEGHLLGPTQLHDSLYLQGQVLSLKRRVHLISKASQPTTVWKNQGIEITGIRIPHANRRHRRVQNIAWLVAGTTQRVLHLGDCEGDKAAFRNLANMLDGGPTPYIIAPYWLGLSAAGRDAMHQLIAAEQGSSHWVFTHLPPQNFEEYVTSLQEFFPEATIFTQPGQKIALR